MRKVLLIVGLVVAFAVPAAAHAAAGQPPRPSVDCGGSCEGGGGGSSGCWQETWRQDRGFDYFNHIHHYVVAQWCKSNGTITSFAIVEHSCDTSGFVSCTPGPAFLTGGGVGWGWVTFEAHANVGITVPKALGYNLTDVFSGSIAPG